MGMSALKKYGILTSVLHFCFTVAGICLLSDHVRSDIDYLTFALMIILGNLVIEWILRSVFLKDYYGKRSRNALRKYNRKKWDDESH